MTVTDPNLVLRLTGSGVDPASPYVRQASTAAELPAHAAWVAASPALMPALVHTWRALDGTVVEQVNPMVPAVTKTGEELKYIWPSGQPPILNVLEHRPDAELVLVVEGTRQLLAAMRYAPPTWQVAGIGGCSSWTVDGVADPRLADLVHGKPVVLLFDADFQSNRAVWEAARKLGETAAAFKATSVKWGLVPGRGVTGLDDVLGGLSETYRAEVLEHIVTAALPKLGRAPRANKESGATPFYNGKSALVEKIAQDILAHRSLAIDASGEVCVYRDGVFRRDYRELRGEVVDRLGDHYTRGATGSVSDVLYKLLADGGMVLPQEVTEPLLNVRNGMLDLRTGKLLKHDPKYLSAQQLPVTWDPKATCPTYDKWVYAQTGDVADLEESISRVLDPSRVPTKAVLLYGPSRSGKSTMLRIIQRIIGKANSSAVTLAQLSADKYSSAQLFGKILNVSADLSADHLSDMSVFKMVTGEDEISAQHKYGQLFTFTNRALFLYSANVPPATSEASAAYIERIRPFIFPTSFAGHEDPSIEDAMMGELSGILVRLVNAYQTWSARGWYRETVPDVADDFATHADRVRAWVRTETERVEKGGTAGRELFEAYTTWAADNAYGRLGLQAFLTKLVSAGVVEYTVSHTRARHFRLRFREGGFDPEPPDPPSTGPKDPETTPSAADSSEISGSGLIVSSYVSSHNEESGSQIDSETVGERRKGKAQTVQLHPVAIDFETPDAELIYDDPSAYSGPFPRVMGWDDGHGFAGTTDDPDRMREVLTSAPWLTVHDGWRFDLPLAAHHLGLDAQALIAKSDDLIIVSRLSRPPRDRDGKLDHYTLDHLATTYLGVPKSDALARLKKEFKGYDRIPTSHPEYLEYLALDCSLTAQLRDIAAPLLDDPYYARERRVAGIAAQLTLTGLRVDTDLLAVRVDEQEVRRADVRKRLVELGFPDTASPGTTKLGRELLEAIAGDVVLPRTATKLVATGRKELQALAVPAGHPLAEPIDLLVALGAERPFAGQVSDHIVDGRVHPEHSISGVNARWSTKRPNVMGVGKRSEALLLDRQLILPEPGHVFIQADLKGIDNRSVAGLSGDRKYAALLEPGVEINAELCRMFFGDNVDFHTMKPKVKAIGHGINFGRGPRGIVNDNPGLELSEVKMVWRRYFKEFPVLAAWQADIRAKAKRGAMLPNGFGRNVRVTPGEEYTEAPARQTAACTRDLAMEGLLRLSPEDLACVRMFLHDELVLSVRRDKAQEVLDRVVDAMSFDWTSPSGLVIPIIAEPATVFGETWMAVYADD